VLQPGDTGPRCANGSIVKLQLCILADEMIIDKYVSHTAIMYEYTVEQDFLDSAS
jgi:hypothetical protein